MNNEALKEYLVEKSEAVLDELYELLDRAESLKGEARAYRDVIEHLMAEPPPVSDLRSLARISYGHVTDQKIQEYAKQNPEFTVREIADEMAVTKETMRNHVDRLYQAGFLTRTPEEDSRHKTQPFLYSLPSSNNGVPEVE